MPLTSYRVPLTPHLKPSTNNILDYLTPGERPMDMEEVKEDWGSDTTEEHIISYLTSPKPDKFNIWYVDDTKLGLKMFYAPTWEEEAYKKLLTLDFGDEPVKEFLTLVVGGRYFSPDEDEVDESGRDEDDNLLHTDEVSTNIYRCMRDFYLLKKDVTRITPDFPTEFKQLMGGTSFLEVYDNFLAAEYAGK